RRHIDRTEETAWTGCRFARGGHTREGIHHTAVLGQKSLRRRSGRASGRGAPIGAAVDWDARERWSVRRACQGGSDGGSGRAGPCDSLLELVEGWLKTECIG